MNPTSSIPDYSENEDAMFFKLENTFQELLLNLKEGASLRFDYGGPYQVTVNLRRATAEEQKNGHGKDTVFCTTTSVQEPSAEILSVFKSLFENRLPVGSKEPGTWSEYIDSEGHIQDNFVVPPSLLPQPFQLFAEQLHTELSDYAKRTLRLLRWRYALRGPHNPIGFREMQWSFDGYLWKAMPTTAKAYTEAIGWLRISENIHIEIERLAGEGIIEPLGHELYREAWHQRHQNPRSALILGIVAAEVGFKQCVGMLVPDAQWLVENVPSPPLGKMIRRYLPLLPVKSTIQGKVLAPPNTLIKVIEEGVELRNKIAHVGAAALTYETLEKVLLAVQDLLWMLDYYCGFDWALEHIRPETRKALKP